MKLYNPFRWHIVKFRDGKYGLRSWALGWVYIDLSNPNGDVYRIDEQFFTFCKGNIETVRKVFKEITNPDYGERINE